MPITNITPLPTPPTRSDPTNFSDRADTFLSALPTMVTEFNTAADQIEAAEAAAETAADTATAMASAAANSAGATVWVSGTPYDQYDPVVDPVDLKTYRAKNAVTSSTRPGLDSSNWAVTQGQGDVVMNGNSFGLRNLVLNPEFRISQRASAYSAPNYTISSSYTNAIAEYTVFDKWGTGSSGATFSTGGAFNISASGFGNGAVGRPLTLDITAGSIRQAISRFCLEDGATYYVTWTGTAQGRVKIGGSTSSYTTSGFSFTGNSLLDTEIEFQGGTLTKVQVEKGIITPFEIRPIDLELWLCQCFYYRSERFSASVYFDAYNATGASFFNTPVVVLPSQLRPGGIVSVPATSASNLSSSGLQRRGNLIVPNGTVTATGRVTLTATAIGVFRVDADIVMA